MSRIVHHCRCGAEIFGDMELCADCESSWTDGSEIECKCCGRRFRAPAMLTSCCVYRENWTHVIEPNTERGEG